MYMSEDDKRDNFIRGMSTRMANQQIGQLHQDISQYEAGLIPPIPEPPQTFVIECNKTQGVQDGDALRTNAWTNTFPPVKLKKGDVVSVNSAFLSTRGAGDLLQFDESNDQTRVIFEYYATNDNANTKRPDYNYKGNNGVGATTNDAYTYNDQNFTNCYPANYRPMRMMRLAETYKTAQQFPGVTPASFPEFTLPTNALPFYSTQKEKFWGYKNASDFVLDASEDKYIDGLFRAPRIALRELMVHCSTPDDTEPDPRDQPFFGLQNDNIQVWYVSTPMSKYGACSTDATMRIYFVFGQEAEAQGPNYAKQLKGIKATKQLLAMLRVGEVIQFKQPSYTFGSECIMKYHHRHTGTGAYLQGTGANAFYCAGYAQQQEGLTINGTDVDRFIQVGEEAPDKENDMSVRGVMGQFMRITKINIGNNSTANKAGSMPTKHVSKTLYETGDAFFNTLPWIEVQCDKGMSLCYNNPNYENADGIPTQTNLLPHPSDTDTEYQYNRSPEKTLQLRVWTCGKSYNNTRVPVPTGLEPTLQKTDLAVIKSGLYPTNPQEADGKALNEDFYVAFRPYYQSTTGGGDNINQSYTMKLVEDKLDVTSRDVLDYTNALGITAHTPNIVAHNYNFSNLNKDGSLDTTSDGYDIQATAKYPGARNPSFWNGFYGNLAQGYDTPLVQDVKRIALYNQGEEYWTNQGSVANNQTKTGGFYSQNNGQDAGTRLTRNQATLNPNTDLYLKNEKGNKMLFFFSEDITETGTPYDGSPSPGWNITQGVAIKPSQCIGGGYNWVVGIKNMVKSKYQKVVPANGLPVPVTPDNGMWYGYNTQAPPATPIDQQVVNVPVTTNGNGPDTGIGDLRFPFSQMNDNVYIRATNHAGETEIMLVKFCPQSIKNSQNYANVAQMDAGNFNAGGFEPSIVQNSGQNNEECAVAMFIIQRDVLNNGTGKKKFVGSARPVTTTPFVPGDYQPSIVSAQWKTHSRRDTADHFEILNGYAHCEHLFELNRTGRDLLPFGDEDLTNNGTYDENFGTDALGLKCGGDFYLCKHANMPVIDDTNVLRMVDNQIRLNTFCLKKGAPDRSEQATASHTGALQWVVHYDYIDLSLNGDKVYFSPTDIANIITKQLHKPADLYKSYVKSTESGGGRYEGGYWKNTAGKYPMNSLFRTIHGPSMLSDGSSSKTDPVNSPSSKDGMLAGPYHDGDFCFELDMTHEIINNGINAFGWTGPNGRLLGYTNGGDTSEVPLGSDGTAPPSGKHFVWIGNQSTALNTLPTTDSYQIIGYTGGEAQPNGFIRTFMDENDYRDGNFQRNLKYDCDATFGPMFIGTNNAQLNYNTDVSRFEWKFLHQSVYSEFASGSDGATSGGNVVAKIFAQSIQGYDNWDRYGGINVVNWCSTAITRGQYTTRRESTGTDPLTLQDAIGNAFMNKLGFSDTWMSENSGSQDYTDVQDYTYKTCYEPLGTTRSDYDVSEARPYTQISNNLTQTRSNGSNSGGSVRTGFSTKPTSNSNHDTPPADTTADKQSKLNYLQNDTTKLSLGGMGNFPTNRLTYNGADPYGIEATAPDGTGTAGTTTNVIIKEVGATLGYGMVNTLATPQAVIYKKTAVTGPAGVLISDGVKVPTDVNMDDVKFPNYEIEVDSSSLLADELPKKTLIGYFLIMSDLIDKHEFIGSANGGQPLKCIGILSKNYENNDFYYSFQSPVEFHVKQDRTITSIRTIINTPDLKDPAGLDYNSSIIYTIVRQQSLPEPDVPPISVQQALDYETMEQMSNQLGVDMSLFDPQSAVGQMGIGNSGGANLNSLRQSLVSAVLNPTQNSASTISRTESMMSSVVSRMPIHARQQAILEAGMGSADEALRPSPQQAQMEGLGIAQPTSKLPTPYLSADQLRIQAFNLTKGNNDPPPGADETADDQNFADNFIGPGGKAPMDPSADDDDIMSLKSAMTKDNELYSLIDSSEVPQSPSELFASSAHNTRQGAGKGLQSVSLPQFFSQYMSIANEQTRQFYRNESSQYGFSVDNPNVWRLATLRTWAGDGNDFDWGSGMYKKIGATLNLEARSKILQAKGRYESLDRPTQKIQRGKELEMIKQRGEDPTSLVIPEPEFGQEDLPKRISRSQPLDPRSRMDEKNLRATDFTRQNPYDLRTWSQKNLQSYQGDTHHGIAQADRTPDNKLSQEATGLLRAESKRRKDGNKRPLQLDVGTGEYKNKKEAPKHYDPNAKHEHTHISIGEMRIAVKGSKRSSLRGSLKTNRVTGIKGDHQMKWTDGYIKGHAIEGGHTANEFQSHENAIKTARKHKGKVTGITKFQKGGTHTWALRGGSNIIPNTGGTNSQSYMFSQQSPDKPKLKIVTKPQEQPQQAEK